jgi:hypothetical protein
MKCTLILYQSQRGQTAKSVPHPEIKEEGATVFRNNCLDENLQEALSNPSSQNTTQ